MMPDLDLSHARGITIRQPWAAAIIFGPKRIENRPRGWPLGTYLVHAGLTLDDTAGTIPVLADWMATARVEDGPWPRGAVVGVARAVGCHRAVGCCQPWGWTPSWVGERNWHLVLADVIALPAPVPCRGALGAWQPPTDVVTAVRHQLVYPGSSQGAAQDRLTRPTAPPLHGQTQRKRLTASHSGPPVTTGLVNRFVNNDPADTGRDIDSEVPPDT